MSAFKNNPDPTFEVVLCFVSITICPPSPFLLPFPPFTVRILRFLYFQEQWGRKHISFEVITEGTEWKAELAVVWVFFLLLVYCTSILSTRHTRNPNHSCAQEGPYGHP